MVDVASSIRTALIGETDITDLLSAYKGSYPVFTRRPVPDDAPYPMIVVSPDIAKSDEDGVNFKVPVLVRDVAVYGRNDSDSYRVVEQLAYAVHDLFHRQAAALSVAEWNVIDIRVSGPIPSPTDDEQTVGRTVTLTIRLNALN